MFSFINKLTGNHNHRKIFLLIMSNVFGLGLLFFRMIYTSNTTFIFLVWNLFLASIPFIISTFYSNFDKKLKSGFFLLLTLAIWLPFFPNAPYILTDLFHLWQKNDIPLWFDLILILTFAWNGMLFGFFSLNQLHRIVVKRYNQLAGTAFVIFSLTAGSFGIYIGRYLRWNSWDIISHPLSLAYDIANVFIHPIRNSSVYGMTIFFSCFLLISYSMIQIAYSKSKR